MTDIRKPARFLERWGGMTSVLMLGLGGLLLAGGLIWIAAAWLSAPDWASVEGQVLEARVNPEAGTRTSGQPSRSGGSAETNRVTLYAAVIVYRYRVGGRDYRNSAIGDRARWRYDTQEEAEAVLAQYGRGKVTVYYDPADPQRSCLYTGLAVLAPLTFMGCGLLLLLSFGFSIHAGRRREAKARESAGQAP